MKKSLLFLVIMVSMNVFAQQLPNSSFEDWETSTISTQEVGSWYSLNVGTVDYPTYGTLQTTDACDGSYALRLLSGRISFPDYNIADTTAIAVLGVMNYTTGTKDGYPFTGRPDKFSFYYKYTPGTVPVEMTDTTLAFIKFTKYDPLGNGDKRENLGYAQWRYWGNAVNEYTKVELPITWWSIETPDSVFVNFASSMTGFGKSWYGATKFQNVLGSELKIDKVQLIYNSSELKETTQQKVSVYPNPAKDKLHLLSDEPMKDYVIYDLLGKIVSTGTVTNQTISISHLPSGCYSLGLQGVPTIRFMKQ